MVSKRAKLANKLWVARFCASRKHLSPLTLEAEPECSALRAIARITVKQMVEFLRTASKPSTAGSNMGRKTLALARYLQESDQRGSNC